MGALVLKLSIMSIITIDMTRLVSYHWYVILSIIITKSDDQCLSTTPRLLYSGTGSKTS